MLIAILSLFWVFWTPGIKVASDFHTSTAANLVANIYPFTWKDSIAAVGLGEYTVSVLWSQPFHAIFGVLSLSNIPFEVVEKILGLLTISIAFFAIRRLLGFFELEFWPKTIGTFFYLTNTFFILLFDGGQLSLALGYGILPLTILYFLRNSIWFSLWLVILSICDIRLVYVVGIIILINLLYSTIFYREKFNFRNLIITIFIPSIVLVGIHAFWLLPAFLSKSPQLPVTYDRASQVDFLSFSSLLHSLLLQQPHWYGNVFGRVSLPQVIFLGIPLLVFTVIFFVQKDKRIGFWSLIALIGIFLSKGSQEPLPEIYNFLFSYIPGFSLFRDPVKFYFLTTIAYTILIAFTVENLLKYSFKNQFLNKLIRALPFLIIIYILYLVRPVFLGQMNGMLSFPLYQKEYSELANNLLKQEDPSVVFWVPTKAPLGFSDSSYPSVDATRIGQKRPFIIGVKGSYETLNFLREAPYMGEIFNVAGIGYIVYPFLDPKKDDMHPDNIAYFYNFTDQLSKLPWLTKIESSPIPLFKTKVHQDKLFVTPNIWWVIGSDDLYNQATTSAQLNLSSNALIFAEEYAGLGKRIDELPNAKIVLNNKTLVDLAASFIENSIIFPAKQLSFDPDKESGWWKREAADLISWRDFLQTKYGIDNQDFDMGGGWAVGEGSKSIKISQALLADRTLKKEDILLARVLESSRSGQLDFYQNDHLIGNINTKKEGNNIRWFEVGQLVEDRGDLIINSSGDINIINALVTLDKKIWDDFKDKASQLEDRVVDFDTKNISSKPEQKIDFEKINPTKYIVNVSGVTEPSFLVLSQTYDGLWKMNNQESLPVYSLINGFRLEKDGQYIVEFEPQKYIKPGMIISLLTAIILIFLLLRYNKDKT